TPRLRLLARAARWLRNARADAGCRAARTGGRSPLTSRRARPREPNAARRLDASPRPGRVSACVGGEIDAARAVAHGTKECATKRSSKTRRVFQGVAKKS